MTSIVLLYVPSPKFNTNYCRDQVLVYSTVTHTARAATLYTVYTAMPLIDACAELAAVHDISYNFKESLFVPFVTKALGELHIPSVYLGQHSLRLVNEHKYLRFSLISNFSDNADIVC